jgi:hypothetical protein
MKLTILFKKGIILSALILFFFAGCQDLFAPREIKYEVTGDVSSVDITMNNKYDNTEQHADVILPFSYEFTVPYGEYFFLYISAQNNDSSGSVTTKIYIDGTVEEQSTSSGSYVISTSSTSVGSLY